MIYVKKWTGCVLIKVILAHVILCVMLISVVGAQTHKNQTDEKNVYHVWENGPPNDPGYFPIAVWMQDPHDAEAYKNAGINLYVGLWEGPTEEQLSLLKSAGMQAVCYQNDVGLKYRNENIIVGWMHGDEPDNAQGPVVNGQWGPPILPEKITADYRNIRAKDPSRPVFLNLGQGVAWNNYIGRGVRKNHPEDYPEYTKGGDVISFDIYPVTSPYLEIKGNLWYVAQGVDRLRTWTDCQKIVWNCIETTKIRAERRATPHELKAEVWMSLIHGSMGIIYFVHEWLPQVDTRKLLHDPEMLEAVTAVNRQIHELAPVLNSPTIAFGAEVTTSRPDIPVEVMVKRYEGETYVFAAGMRNGTTDASFLVSGLSEKTTAEVIGEERRIEVVNSEFQDTFEPYEVHLYKIRFSHK